MRPFLARPDRIVQPSFQLTRRFALVALGPILLLAIWLRLPSLVEQSLWRDEVATWDQVSGTLIELFIRTANDNYPPLQNLFTFASLHIFGDSEWALRSPSALLGILNVWLIYGLANRLCGRSAGLAAALLLALSGFHIYYSQEARMYALLAAAATGFAWATLVHLQQPSWRSAGLSVLAGLALVYAHPYGALDWLAIALGAAIILLRGGQVRRLLDLALVQLAIALGFLPWALLLLMRASAINGGTFWIGPLTPRGVYQSLDAVFSDLLLPFTVLLALSIVPLWQARATTRTWLLLWCWALLPIVVGIVASELIKPVFLARYVIGSLPAFIAIAALLITRLAIGWKSLAAVSALLAVAGIVSLTIGAPPPREQWREPIQAALQQMPAGGCFAVDRKHDQGMLNYYAHGRNGCVVVVDLQKINSNWPDTTLFYVTPGGRSGSLEKLGVAYEDVSQQQFERGSLHVLQPKPFTPLGLR